MLILSINTAFAALEGAVLRGRDSLAEARTPMQRGQDAALPGFVADLLREAGVSLNDIERLVVVTGPGSFTGIRIGVSYMRGLALVLDVPCLGFTSLEASIPLEVNEASLCALQAQKRPPDQTWWVQDLTRGMGDDAPIELDRADVLARIAGHSGPVFVSGSDALLPEAEDAVLGNLVPSALIAGQKALGAAPEAHSPSPVYARAPDAALPKASAAQPMAILVMRPDDAGVMARLHATGFAKGWSPVTLRGLLKETGVLALGVDVEGALGGFAIVRTVAGESDLLTIVSDPSRLRTGIAVRLLKALESRLGERGVSRWTLDVAEDNQAAISLYQRTGFSEDGRRKGYYTTGREKPVDAILMSRRLGL